MNPEMRLDHIERGETVADYSVSEVCAKTGISYETLKYYGREGIIVQVRRDRANRRIFDEKNIDWIQDVLTLRQCRMGIAEMKTFTSLCLQGESTIEQRKAMFEAKKAQLMEELEQLERTIACIQAQKEEYDRILRKEQAYTCSLDRSSTKPSSALSE